MKIISKETNTQVNINKSNTQGTHPVKSQNNASSHRNAPPSPNVPPQVVKQQVVKQQVVKQQVVKQQVVKQQVVNPQGVKQQGVNPQGVKPQSVQRKKSKTKQQEVARNRKIHLEDEKRKRAQGQSYLSVQYNKFISLLRFNITFKLTLGYAIRLIFLIGFVFFVIYISFSYYMFYDAGLQLKDDVKFISNQLSLSAENNVLLSDLENTDGHIIDFITAQDLELYVYDVKGDPIFSSNDVNISYQSTHALVEYDFKQFPYFPDIYETGTVVTSEEVTLHFAIKSKLDQQTRALEATFPIGFVLCIVLIVSSIRSSSKMANKHMKPILTMTEQVKDMSANSLDTRLNVSGTKDELKDLAVTFNQMLNDIQKSYEREKQFVSDASHELRTPIAVIKGYAGMLNRWGKNDPAILEESIQAILGETDNMHSLVESLLFIARNDKGTLKMDQLVFNFSELFKEIVKETRLIDTQHILNETITPSVYIYGSADKLKQALRIFIDNSIKYTVDQGQITLSLKRSEKHIILIISDNGIGISKEDLPHIFDRFYRADKSRTKMRENQHGGTGLGLSIAKIIIEQHGGSIHVDSALNEGTTFTLFLPVYEKPVDLGNTVSTELI